MKNAEDFISNTFLNSYKGVNADKSNMIISTIVANFQIKFGLKNKGIDIIKNIIKNIQEDTLCNIERNIFLWNMYVLIDEYIDLGEYSLSMDLIEKAKRNYSRDVILGDNIGSFHISWFDQILLREARLNIESNNKSLGENICMRVIDSRNSIKEKAATIGEYISVDRCRAMSYKYLSEIYSGVNNIVSTEYIRKSLYYKINNKDLYNIYIKKAKEIEKRKNIESSYLYLVKCYYKEKKPSYDNIKYSYCISCIYNDKKTCTKNNIKITDNKSCSLYKLYGCK